MRRFQGDFQSQLKGVLAISDSEDSAKGAVGDVLLYVKLVADFSTQQLGFEYVDVRDDGHGSLGGCFCGRGIDEFCTAGRE